MPLRAHQALFVGLLTAVTVGALLRGSWLTSDPPTHAATGIVWHDEGPWVHNARNRALWGTWRTDEWNPVFLTPVFTALEYRQCDLDPYNEFAMAVPIAFGQHVLPVADAVKQALAKALGDWKSPAPFVRVPQPLVPPKPVRLNFPTPDKQNAVLSVRLEGTR